jgi:hypothetical protein
LAIKPYYKEFNRETGKWLWVLLAEDYEKVRQGYACPNCLEDFNGVYMLECPVCNHMADTLADFIGLPDYMVPEPDPIYSE